MAEILDDTQVIANTLGLEKHIVEGILSGEISDEVLENYDINKPPEIKVVEQKKFIRSRTIGVVATNNIEGSILTSSLAVLLANRVQFDVAIADFNEFPSQTTCLGINSREKATYINFPFNEDESFLTKGTFHPELANLSLFLGSTGPVQHQSLTKDKIITLISNISTNYSTVFIDCPNNLFYWEALVPYLDFIIVAVEQNLINLSRYTHIYNYLDSINVLDRTSLVLLSDGQNGNLTSTETRKHINTLGHIPVLGVLPYDTSIKNPVNIFKGGKYTNGVNNILDGLFPEHEKKKKKGFLNSLAENLNL